MIAAGVAASALVLLLAFALDELASGVLPRGVRVLDLDLSRLDAARARRALEPAARARIKRPLTVAIDGKALSIVPERAGFSIDVAATLERARALGRRGGLFRRFGAWIESLVRAPAIVPPVVRIGAGPLLGELARLENAALPPVFAGGFRFEDARLVASPPRAGRGLERVEAARRLRRALAEGAERVVLPTVALREPFSRAAIDRLLERAQRLLVERVVLADAASDRRLELDRARLGRALRVAPGPAGTDPELELDPDELTRGLEAVLAAVETPPRAARLAADARNRVHVVPSEPGARLARRLLSDAVLAAASAPSAAGILPLDRSEPPALDSAAARALGVRALVFSFTTRHACCQARVENIHRIADLLDGLVVKPGETLSVNAVVGARSKANGFVLAPGIEDGEMVDSIGGGVSQFATTLFNAVLRGGYDIVERQPHTYWFPRYPMGHEATLSYPKPDLVFKNDTAAGLLIDTVYGATFVTVRLFGDSGGRKVKTEISARKDIVEPPVRIAANPTLAPEAEKVAESGMIGWSVMASRTITFADGSEKVERRKVTYAPRVRVVEVHPCRVPKGEQGYTGEPCPLPEDSAESVEAEASTDPSAPREPGAAP